MMYNTRNNEFISPERHIKKKKEISLAFEIYSGDIDKYELKINIRCVWFIKVLGIDSGIPPPLSSPQWFYYGMTSS